MTISQGCQPCLCTNSDAYARPLTYRSCLYAEAEAAYLQGQGIARQRQAIVNGLRESVLNFEDGVKAVSPQEVIELMMVGLPLLSCL